MTYFIIASLLLKFGLYTINLNIRCTINYKRMYSRYILCTCSMYEYHFTYNVIIFTFCNNLQVEYFTILYYYYYFKSYHNVRIAHQIFNSLYLHIFSRFENEYACFLSAKLGDILKITFAYMKLNQYIRSYLRIGYYFIYYKVGLRHAYIERLLVLIYSVNWACSGQCTVSTVILGSILTLDQDY